MSVRKIRAAPAERLQACSNAPRFAPSAESRWNVTAPRAAYVEDRTINIYSVIGEAWDYDGYEYTQTGTTSMQIAQILSDLGPGPITVNVNSPGGDMFEGLAIYNLLREHQGEITVNVIGVAASAASTIVMAADVLRMGKSSFLMIHNTWLYTAGNRNDLTAMAAKLLPFDKAMAAIISDRTGRSVEDIMSLMDAETWINGEEAVSGGFADALLGDEDTAKETPKVSARVPKTPRASAAAADLADEALLSLSAAVRSLNFYL